MSDQNYYIGEAAGKVYQTLEKNGPSTLSNIQKESKITDSALFNQAIGWLAREAKLNFSKKGKSVEVALSQVGACC